MSGHLDRYGEPIEGNEPLDPTSTLARTPDEIRQHIAELRAVLATARTSDNPAMTETTRVACNESGCRSELICRTRHADNLNTSWRCLDHRLDLRTTPTKENN